MGFFSKISKVFKQIVKASNPLDSIRDPKGTINKQMGLFKDPTGDKARKAKRQEGEAQDARNRADASDRASVQRSDEERKKRQMEASENLRSSRRGIKGSRRSLLTGDDRGTGAKDITG